MDQPIYPFMHTPIHTYTYTKKYIQLHCSSSNIFQYGSIHSCILIHTYVRTSRMYMHIYITHSFRCTAFLHMTWIWTNTWPNDYAHIIRLIYVFFFAAHGMNLHIYVRMMTIVTGMVKCINRTTTSLFLCSFTQSFILIISHIPIDHCII